MGTGFLRVIADISKIGHNIMKTTASLFVGFLLTFGFSLSLCQGAPPNAVTQGRFAWLLFYYFENARAGVTPEQVQQRLDSEKNLDPSKAETQRAVDALAAMGLSPYMGWRPEEPVTRHVVTSLLVKSFDDTGSVDIQDPDACLAFAEKNGFDTQMLGHVCRDIWKRKNPGGGQEPAASPEP